LSIIIYKAHVDEEEEDDCGGSLGSKIPVYILESVFTG
jgi:hypothetical protein